MVISCKKTNKISHISKGAAEAHLRSLPNPDISVAYRCRFCMKWHVGRMTDRKRTYLLYGAKSRRGKNGSKAG